MDEALEQFGAVIAGALDGAVTDHAVAFGELTIIDQCGRHHQGRHVPT